MALIICSKAARRLELRFEASFLEDRGEVHPTTALPLPQPIPVELDLRLPEERVLRFLRFGLLIMGAPIKAMLTGGGGGGTWSTLFKADLLTGCLKMRRLFTSLL